MSKADSLTKKSMCSRAGRMWLQGAVGAVALYAVTFVLLMNPAVPAFNVQLQIEYDFSYRFARIDVVQAGGFTTEIRYVSWANLLFMPAEKIAKMLGVPDRDSFYYNVFPRKEER